MVVGVRRITNTGGKKRISKFASILMKTMIWCESPIERDYAFYLDSDPCVLSFYSQPMRIYYFLDGKEHHYTPDFLVCRIDKKQIIEIKPEAKVFSDDNPRLFRIISSICRREGYEFLVVTDLMIRVQPKFDNIKLLHRYGRTLIHPQHQIICQEFFSNKQEATFTEVEQFLKSKGATKQDLYALLYRGILTTNLMDPIGSDSVISLSSITDLDKKGE